MKNLLSLWGSLLWLCLCVQAQQLTTVEYYFNNDPGLGNGTKLPASTEIETSIDISGLEKGVHTLYVRAKDSKNKWSLLQHRTFIKVGFNATNTPLKSIEYYFDEDPGIGKGKPIEADVEIETSIDISGLDIGVHTLYVRAQDQNDNWSLLQHHTFIKGVVGVNDALPEIAYLEYYIDNDPGLGQGNSLDFFSNGLQLNEVYTNYTVDLSAFKDGVHNIYIRAKDDNEHWSMLQHRTFIKLPLAEPAKITEIEVKVEGVEPYNEWTPLTNFMPDVDVTTNFAIVEMCDLPNGEYTIQARAIDDEQRTGPIFDELLEIDCRIPQIELNNAIIKDKQPLTITGKGFKSDCVVSITLKGLATSDSQIFEATTDEAGNFEYNLIMPDNFETGFYFVQVACAGQDTKPNDKWFNYEKTEPPLGIQIISPIMDDENKGDQVIVRWNDLIAFQNQYSNFLGLKKQLSYNVYYKSETDLDWVLAKEHTVEIYKNIPKIFLTTIEVPLEGKYKVKVENAKNDIYFDESEEFTVYGLTSEGYQVDFLWDKSFPENNIKRPLGVVSDGVARIVMQLSDYTGLENITKVEVRLSDPQGKATRNSVLGKVMLATDDISKYSNEANNANEITAIWDIENYSTTQDKINFWYVAPDDFSENEDYYFDQASERKVTVIFSITFDGGTTTSIFRDIEIVRPPLMLVHGFNSDKYTWDNFSSEKKDETISKFIYDNRFKHVNAINIHPHSLYGTNARFLLGIKINKDGNIEQVSKLNKNSLTGNIIEMREIGYACNQVNYVGHSMGGVVIRVAEEKYSDWFYQDQTVDEFPYSNYGKGFVNRLITLNSPHNGAFVADFVFSLGNIINNFFSNIQLANPECIITNEAVTFFNGSDGFNDFFDYNYDPYSCKLSVFNTKAIENLRMIEGYKLKKSNLVNHLIASSILLPGSIQDINEYEEFINSFPLPISDNLDKILTIVFADGNNNLENATLEFAIKNYLVPTVETKLKLVNFYETFIKALQIQIKGYNATKDLIELTDGAISVESQLASNSKGQNHISYYDKTFHSHFSKLDELPFSGPTKSIKYGNKVFELLNYDTKEFSNSIPAKTDGGLIAKASNNIDLTNYMSSKLNYNPDGLEILYPTNEEIVFNDSLLNIKIALIDTTNLSNVKVYFQDEFLSFANINDTLINQTIAVSDQYLGKQDLTVTGIYNYGDSTSLAIETITLNVQSKESPVDLIIEPAINYGFAGESITPSYYAVFPTFVSELKSTNTDISVEIENETILQFNKTNNTFTGKAEGETFAIIKYFDTADTAQFIIYPSYEEVEPTDTMDTIDDIEAVELFEPIVNIYPNPAENEINIDYSLITSGKVSIEIVDIAGRSVRSLNVGLVQSNIIHTEQIKLTNISQGMYMMNLYLDNYKYSSNKFIVNK